MAKQYFWDKLKRARAQQDKRRGRASMLDVSDAALAAVTGEPLEIAGFDSPQQAVARARSMSMTGGGANGVIEPNNPVALLNTTGGPATIHEGELLVQPEGAPPNTRQVLSNAQLKELENRYNVPGMFSGSKRYPRWQQQQVMKRMEKDYGMRGYQGSSIIEPPVTTTPGQVTVEGPQLDIAPVTVPVGQSGGIPRVVAQTPDIDATGQTEQVTIEEPAPTPAPESVEAASLALPAPEAIYQPTPESTQIELPEGALAYEAIEVEPTPEPAPDWVQRFTGGLPPAEEAGIYGAGAAEGFDFLRAVARGESPALDIAENRALEELSARQAYDDIAFDQQAAGMSPAQRATLKAMHERGQRAATGELLANIAEKRAQTQTEAARDLASQGLQQARWEAEYAQRLQEYGDRQGWTQYSELLNSGNFDAAAAKYHDITGDEIDLKDVREEYYNTRGAKAAAELAAIVDRTWHALKDEDGDGMLDWQDSPAIMGAVERYWRWNNDGEDFDPNNPAHVSHMNDEILASMSMSDVSENIAKLKMDPWYQDLIRRAEAGDQDAITELAKWDAALTGLSQISYLDGYQIAMEDGKIVFKDANGETVYSVDPPPGVFIPDYESLGGIEDLLGDDYMRIRDAAQGDDPDENAIVAELMDAFGFSATQAERAYEMMRYEGYDDYVASCENADETSMSEEEWLAAGRPEDVRTAGIPEGVGEGDIWYDAESGEMYILTEGGREEVEYIEGDWWSSQNLDMIDAWADYAAEHPDAEPPADVVRVAGEMATMVLSGDHVLPPEMGSNPQHPVYQAMLNHPDITHNIGHRELRDPDGVSADEYYYDSIGRRPSSGSYINYHGRLLRYDGFTHVNQNHNDANVYYYIDVATGTKWAVRADYSDYNVTWMTPAGSVSTESKDDGAPNMNSSDSHYRYLWQNAESSGDYSFIDEYAGG